MGQIKKGHGPPVAHPCNTTQICDRYNKKIQQLRTSILLWIYKNYKQLEIIFSWQYSINENLQFFTATSIFDYDFFGDKINKFD